MKLFGRRRKAALAQKAESERTVQDPLLILSHGDREMYDAMSRFLLLKPEEQIPQLGSTEQLLQKSNEAIGKGDLTVARVDLETATRIEMYNGNAEKVKTLLNKALDLHENLAHEKELRILLSNLDQAMRIAKEYYKGKSPKLEQNPALVRS